MRFYHLTLITPKGDTEPLEPEGSPLGALWHIRKTLREEPPGSVGVVTTAIGEGRGPYRTLYRARKATDGSIEPTPHDAILGHLPAAQRDAILRAIDAFGGGEPDEHLLAHVIAAAMGAARS